MRYGVDVGRSGVKVAAQGVRIFLPSIISLLAGKSVTIAGFGIFSVTS